MTALLQDKYRIEYSILHYKAGPLARPAESSKREQEGDEDDDDEGNRDLRLRFLFDRPETTEEGWVALTTTCCLTRHDKMKPTS
jgi:hypothetical protein